MTYRIGYSSPALRDLREIEERIRAAAGDSVADQFIHRIVEKADSLREMPTRQRLRTELQSDLRAVSVADYLIFYRVESDAVMIVRILHGSRNITAKLSPKGRDNWLQFHLD